jgi:uncharacterized lipoprotein
MKKQLFPLALITLLAGCSVSQEMQLTRTSHYDAQGNLTGYSVAETLVIKEVSRPMEDKNPTISYFSVDKNSSKAAWPPIVTSTNIEPATTAEVTSITTEPAAPAE